jgi:hypothetical protein
MGSVRSETHVQRDLGTSDFLCVELSFMLNKTIIVDMLLLKTHTSNMKASYRQMNLFFTRSIGDMSFALASLLVGLSHLSL